MISAVILAAGESRRMGRPKMPLPWGGTSVLGKVVAAFASAGLQDIVVVTGGARRQVEALVGTTARTVFNPDYAAGEMLSSLQAGLAALRPETDAALIGLGDQPQVEEKTIRLLLEEFERTEAALIVPSFQMRRGHPWLAARPLWGDLMKMRPPESPREFLNRHADEIHYVTVDTPSILRDLDTPEDYARQRPRP